MLFLSFILIVFGTIGAIIVGVASKLLSDEFKAWTPHWTDSILRIAIRQVPAELRERVWEEWCARVGSTPGDVSKLFVAMGCISIREVWPKAATASYKPRWPEAERNNFSATFLNVLEYAREDFAAILLLILPVALMCGAAANAMLNTGSENLDIVIVLSSVVFSGVFCWRWYDKVMCEFWDNL